MLIAHSTIYLANMPVDMRKSINGLSLLVIESFNCNPTCGAYFVFCNRKKDKIKILYWDKNGFALWYKRLEKSTFQFAHQSDGKALVTSEQLQWLLSGLDYQSMKKIDELNYDIFQ